MRTLVKTGKCTYAEPDVEKIDEWKRALVLGALVKRNGGPIRIKRTELLALMGCTLHVEHHKYEDEIVIGLTGGRDPRGEISCVPDDIAERYLNDAAFHYAIHAIAASSDPTQVLQLVSRMLEQIPDLARRRE